MKVFTIPFFKDNYCYAVCTSLANTLCLVDPADFSAVSTYISANSSLQNLHLKYVFSTHRHYDHAGANFSIREQYPSINIIGGKEDNIPGCTFPVQDNDSFTLENGVHVKVLHTPCHTRGHILYYMTYNSDTALFTGDTLFVGGCGRFFEGDGADMLKAMNKIKSLPDETKIYCGHEYTLANLQWAAQIDTENPSIKSKLRRVACLRENNEPTVPSTVGEEKATNLFMNTARLARLLNAPDEASAMSQLRRMKDSNQTL